MLAFGCACLQRPKELERICGECCGCVGVFAVLHISTCIGYFFKVFEQKSLKNEEKARKLRRNLAKINNTG